MVRFIHTADNHLGSPFVGLREENITYAALAIDASYEAFKQVVDKALGECVDFVLVSGDLYDTSKQHIQEQAFVKREFERLAQAGIAVFLIHGNHDYGNHQDDYLPDNVYTFTSTVSTHVFQTKEGEQVAVSGFSYDTRWVNESYAQQFPTRYDDVDVHIGLYHGDMKGNRQGKISYAPFLLSDLKSRHYDYWALGHIHQRTTLSTSPLIVYPGNTQGRSFKEQGEKGAYLVEITTNEKPHLSFFRTDSIQWRVIEVDVTAHETMTEWVLAVLKSLESLQDQSVRQYDFVRLVIRTSQEGRYSWGSELKRQVQEALVAHQSKLKILEVQIKERHDSRTADKSVLLTSEDEPQRLKMISDTLMQHPLIVRYFSEELTTDELEKVLKDYASRVIESEIREEEFDENF